MYKERVISDRIRRLAENFPVVVVSGARQVGKSTLLEHLYPERRMITFDPVSDIGGARRDPDIFLDNYPSPLILDEIQYAPELVPAIKRRVDQAKTNNMYILTGSQQWSMMKNVAESLAGRAVFVDISGFSLAEIAQEYAGQSWLERWLTDPSEVVANRPARLNIGRTLYQQIWRGRLPKADSLEDDLVQTFLRGYMQTYLERDVRLVADIDGLDELGKFTQLVAALTGQEINYSQLGREIGITPQTAKRWLNVLRATFQWLEVPAYSGNTIKRISSKPKGYICDTGLACMLNSITTAAALGGQPGIGSLFETTVVTELAKMLSFMSAPAKMYHWRSHGQAEVDIVLERDGRLFPIEVKLTSNPARTDTAGMRAFRNTFTNANIAPGLIICPCSEFRQITETDYAMPWDAK